MCGTLDYLPPEMVDREPYHAAADLWCLGVLTYEFLVGTPPFETNSAAQTHDKIRRVDFEFPKGVMVCPPASCTATAICV